MRIAAELIWNKNSESHGSLGDRCVTLRQHRGKRQVPGQSDICKWILSGAGTLLSRLGRVPGGICPHAHVSWTTSHTSFFVCVFLLFAIYASHRMYRKIVAGTSASMDEQVSHRSCGQESIYLK